MDTFIYLSLAFDVEVFIFHQNKTPENFMKGETKTKVQDKH